MAGLVADNAPQARAGSKKVAPVHARDDRKGEGGCRLRGRSTPCPWLQMACLPKSMGNLRACRKGMGNPAHPHEAGEDSDTCKRGHGVLVISTVYLYINTWSGRGRRAVIGLTLRGLGLVALVRWFAGSLHCAAVHWSQIANPEHDRHVNVAGCCATGIRKDASFFFFC